MNLALIGFRGTGKTTIARLLAEQLAWAWLDLDAELERAAGMSIADIFSTAGEGAFRDLETQTLERFAACDQTVIATGGGVVLRPENRAILAAEVSQVAWLQAPAAVLWQRIQQDGETASRRPNLTSQGGLAEIEQLLAERSAWYAQCASIAVNTADRPPQEIADEILFRLDLR